MKYITFQTIKSADIIIFPINIEHAQMFRMISDSDFWHLDQGNLIGAGFVNFESMTCYGESVSIDTASTERCTSILRAHCKYKNWTKNKN